MAPLGPLLGVSQAECESWAVFSSEAQPGRTPF